VAPAIPPAVAAARQWVAAVAAAAATSALSAAVLAHLAA